MAGASNSKVSRRAMLGTVAGAIGGLAVGSVVGWLARTPEAAPATTITQTVTRAQTITQPIVTTQTVTVTGTATPPVGLPERFDGVEVAVMTQPWNMCPVKHHRVKWEEMTGGKIRMIEFPYAELRPKAMDDFLAKAGTYDILIFPGGLMGDYAGGGHLENLDPWIQRYGFPALEDILPACRKVAEWAGHLYAVPYDGDCHILYYRKDVLTDPEYQRRFKNEYGYPLPVPPKTWEEVRDVAKFFNGWDWDKERPGETKYGIAFIAKRGTQAQWTILDLIAQYNVIPGKPSRYAGHMFFDPVTMEPLMNTPGAIAALEMLLELKNYAPPGLLGYGFAEFRDAYVKGGVAVLGIDWGDVGIMEWMDPGSVVKGKLGYAPLPGATRVWDRQHGRWINKYNQNDYGDFGGWVMGISTYSKKKEAAFHLLRFLNDPAQSILDATGTIGCWGSNPYRYSHFDLEKWVAVGFGEDSAREYLSVIERILSNPLHLIDLKIPGRDEYYDKLDAHLANAFIGAETPEEAMRAVYEEWEQVTDSLGRERQKRLYIESLGIKV
ncbi:putative ABC transporter-binding protein [Candidatus Calditenuaceae archaeon HR02]|nr:putative ABC transporter-binding protein [Candidatus Calditenuaceae archaeon HR02]